MPSVLVRRIRFGASLRPRRKFTPFTGYTLFYNFLPIYVNNSKQKNKVFFVFSGYLFNLVKKLVCIDFISFFVLINNILWSPVKQNTIAPEN